MEETRSGNRTRAPNSSHNCRAVLCPRLASLPLDQPDSHGQQLPGTHNIRQDSVSVPSRAYFDFGLKWVCLKIGYPKTSSHNFSFFRNSQFWGYPKFWYKPPNLIVVYIPIIFPLTSYYSIWLYHIISPGIYRYIMLYSHQHHVWWYKRIST